MVLYDEDIALVKSFLDKHKIYININNKLGEGTFGKVYSGIFNDNDVAVKIVELKYETDINYFEKEIKFAKTLTDISPIIYFSDIKQINYKYIGILVMEKMDMDCLQALKDKSITNIQKMNIINDMIKILHHMIDKYNIICSDIKPGNFLYNKSDRSIKIIDFDGYTCFDVIDKNFKFNLFFGLLLLQLYICILKYVDCEKLLIILINQIFYGNEYFLSIINEINDENTVLDLQTYLVEHDDENLQRFVYNIFWYVGFQDGRDLDDMTGDEFLGRFRCIIEFLKKFNY